VQTFSYLQRNIADKNYIKLAPIAAVLFLYGSISTLNPYLPPLFGVLMATAYFVGRREFLFFAFGYLLIFEADRGYYLFSGFLFLIFYIYYFLPFVAAFLDCTRKGTSSSGIHTSSRVDSHFGGFHCRIGN
jgi:hypothetical protein